MDRVLTSITWATLVSIILIACAGKATVIPNATSQDAKVFYSRCGTCHSVPHPKRHTFEQWKHILAVMEKQMEDRGVNPLTRDEREAILRYLKDNAR